VDWPIVAEHKLRLSIDRGWTLGFISVVIAATLGRAKLVEAAALAAIGGLWVGPGAVHRISLLRASARGVVPHIAHHGWLFIALAVVPLGCGTTDGQQGSPTTGSVVTPTSEPTVRVEPTGPETPQSPINVGLAIPLGGLPVGGAAGFSADQSTQCVGVALTDVPTIPQGVSIAVTRVRISSNPAKAFSLSHSSQCQNPCDTYSFTSTNGQCDVSVTWNTQSGDSHGSIALDGQANCGTTDRAECQAWSADVKKRARSQVELDAYGETTTTTTTTTTTSTTGTPATSTSTQPSPSTR
jgi:hypothetical protein